MFKFNQEQNKDLRLSIRLSKNDKLMLEELSHHYNLNMSEVIISMIKHHYSEIKEAK